MAVVVLTAVGVCFVIGALDYALGGRLKLADVFFETFSKMGAVTLGVMGLCSLAPAAAGALGKAIVPAAKALNMDPAAFPALLFPVDMGGWNLCTALAADEKTGVFFGAVASSAFGACTGYCVPVASRVVEKRFHDDLALGTLAGLTAIPVALLAAGLAAGLEIRALAWNLLPFAALSAALCYGLLRHFRLTVTIFTGFGRALSAAGIAGIALQCLRTLNIWDPLPSMLPFSEAASVVVRIAITMTGSMLMIALINKFCRRPIEFLGQRIGVEGRAVSGVLAATASALIVYTEFAGYSKRGRVMLAAACASAAFVFGGQLSIVSSWAPETLGAFLTAKLLAGFLAICFALILFKRREAAGGA